MRSHSLVFGALGFVLLAACSGGKGGGSDPTPTPTPCVAETDAAFCARLAERCESVTANDNCGTARSADCGSCGGTDACVASVCKAPVCANLSFANSVVSDASVTNAQDIIAGASTNGAALLIQRGPDGSCDPAFSLFLADRSGTTYTSLDATAVSGLSNMLVGSEDAVTLAADGLTLIGVNTARTAFLQSARATPGTVSFADAVPGPFANIVASGTQTLYAPVLSPDGREFFYTVAGDADPAVNGIYHSVRSPTTFLFPAGTRMPAPVQDYSVVRAISSDRMTLFVELSFVTYVLSRTSVTQPFANPNAPSAAPTIPGFRARPSADCGTVYANCTVSGCLGEEVCINTP